MYRDIRALPLDSPRWKTLSSGCGRSPEVPALLLSIATTRPLSILDRDGPLGLLFDQALELDSVYGVGYASFPYLVARATQVDGRDLEELCLLLGWIAAGHATGPIPDDVALAFRAALPGAAELTVGLLARGPVETETAHSLALAALAMIGHRAGRLPEGSLDPGLPHECECTSCGASYFVALYSEGIAAHRDPRDPPARPDATQPSLRWPESPVAESPGRSAWRELAARLRAQIDHTDEPEVSACLEVAAAACDAGIDAHTDVALALTVVAAAAIAHGNLAHGRQLMRLAGTVRCPACGVIAPITSQMVDFQPST